MKSELIMSVTPTETRVARLENGAISELLIERAQESGYTGNIYKGKIVRVLPGMQAAFLDVGLDRTAFLYVNDIARDGFDLSRGGGSQDNKNGRSSSGRRSFRGPVQIQDLVKEGQEILVQVARDPIGTKGARLTGHISLPGRYLVYMPTVDHIGVSSRIRDDNERYSIRKLLEKNRPKRGGLIARTVCEGVPDEDLVNDRDYLVNLMEEIEGKARSVSAPALIHAELEIVLRSLRDLFTPDIERVVIDGPGAYEKVTDFVETFMPRMKDRIEKYEGNEPSFDAFGIEIEISRALSKKVWLKSGGYLIIEQTEALTAIDVNTGKFVGKTNLEDTILQTNLEAAKEIAYQLKLRNIGGIIIIDFIDMARASNRERVYQACKEIFKEDRSRTTLTKITELGLVEMTRKRTRESLGQRVTESCFYCDGKGYIKSRTSICGEIFREIGREASMLFEKIISVEVHPAVAETMLNEEQAGLEAVEHSLGKRVSVIPREDFHMEQYEILDGEHGGRSS
jgi:ribonuclease G